MHTHHTDTQDMWVDRSLHPRGTRSSNQLLTAPKSGAAPLWLFLSAVNTLGPFRLRACRPTHPPRASCLPTLFSSLVLQRLVYTIVPVFLFSPFFQPPEIGLFCYKSYKIPRHFANDRSGGHFLVCFFADLPAAVRHS